MGETICAAIQLSKWSRMCISSSDFHRPPKKEADWSRCRLIFVRSLSVARSSPEEGAKRW